MNKKIGLGSVVKAFVYLILILVFLMPFILVVSVSLSNDDTILKYGYTFFPKTFDLSSYNQIFKNADQLIQSYKITIVYSALATVLVLVVQSMVAYSLSRSNFKLRKILTGYFFVTMLFSGGLVPSYILNTRYLHLDNTLWIYILGGVSTWNIIIMRTFFKGLPDGLVEAAKIDGASEFRVFGEMIIPLSKPVLATIGFMTLLAKWNDWNTSLIYIKSPQLYSLQYLLQKILREAQYLEQLAQSGMQTLGDEAVQQSTDSMKFAMAVLAAGPMLFVFPFFQKYFCRGLTVGSVKG